MAVPASPSIGSRILYTVGTTDPVLPPNTTVAGLITALAANGSGASPISVVLFPPAGPGGQQPHIALTGVLSATAWAAAGSPPTVGRYTLMDAAA